MRQRVRTQTAVRLSVRRGASATDTNAMRRAFHSAGICESARDLVKRSTLSTTTVLASPRPRPLSISAPAGRSASALPLVGQAGCGLVRLFHRRHPAVHEGRTWSVGDGFVHSVTSRVAPMGADVHRTAEGPSCGLRMPSERPGNDSARSGDIPTRCGYPPFPGL